LPLRIELQGNVDPFELDDSILRPIEPLSGRPNVRLQPPRLMITLAAIGCKPLLD
jgi:hypothetical protein